MSIELILQILNLTGFTFAVIALILLVYICCIMIQLPPKELREHIKRLNRIKANAIPQLKRVIEFVIPEEEAKVLDDFKCNRELHGDWSHS